MAPLAASALVVSTTSVSALSVYFDPLNTTIGVGQSFTLNMRANASQSEAILGWDFDVLFDSAQVAYGGGTVGGQWFPVLSVDGGGLAGLAFPEPVYGDNILLATLSFRCLGPGFSLIRAGFDDNMGVNEGILLANGQILTDWESSPAGVTQVPANDTSTLLMLGLGAGLAVFLSRRAWGFARN